MRYIIEKVMTSELSGVTYVERRASIEVADDEAAIAAMHARIGENSNNTYVRLLRDDGMDKTGNRVLTEAARTPHDTTED